MSKPTVTIIQEDKPAIVSIADMIRGTYGIVVDAGGSNVVFAGDLVLRRNDIVFSVQGLQEPTCHESIRIRPVSVEIKIIELD